jgi:hypothetical protein
MTSDTLISKNLLLHELENGRYRKMVDLFLLLAALLLALCHEGG